MRKELWGYAPDEALSGDDLLKVKYQVRRLSAHVSQKTVRETLGALASPHHSR